MADLDALAQDKDFMSASPQEKAQYLREVVLPKADPEFAKASPQEQESYLHQVVLPKFGSTPLQGQVTAKGPGVIEGVGNVLGAVGKGLANAGKAAINPQTYTGIVDEVGNALATEGKSRELEAAGKLPDPQHYGRPNALDLIGGAGRNVVNGITGIPADVANAYTGKDAFHNDWQIPASPREDYLRKNYPASLGLGDQLPYAIPIAGEGNLLRTAAEGAGIGALQNNGEGLSGRVANAAAGAAIPAAIKGTGKLLQGRLGFARELPAVPELDHPTLKNTDGNLEAIQAQRNGQQVELPVSGEELRSASQAPNQVAFRKQNKQIEAGLKLYDQSAISGQAPMQSKTNQDLPSQSEKLQNVQSIEPIHALKNLHTSVDEFHAQPTKNYKSLAIKARDLAQHVSEDEFESAMGKLSREDLNAVGRLLGC